MSLTRKEAFKRLFIKQCTDEGLVTEGQVLDRIAACFNEKQAFSPADLINNFNERLRQSHSKDDKGKTGPSPVPAAVALSIALPAAMGAGGGILASKLKGNWLDEEDVKNDELIQELRRQTQLAQQFKRMGGTTPQSF